MGRVWTTYPPLFYLSRMISTKKIVLDNVNDIPSTWIFEHYLSLSTPLYGQEIKIKSVFNPTERTPSMSIYPSKSGGKYVFMDFSSGNKGDGYDLVKALYNISPREAVIKVITDYKAYVKNNKVCKDEIRAVSKFAVVDYESRNWNSDDAKFWTKFGIGSKSLEQYNVMPLKSFDMAREGEKITVANAFLYGYFRDDGKLYKVYQPKNHDHKFIKVLRHIQGIDQLTYAKPNLVIASSLKDLLSFNGLGFKTIECVAPDSENTLIPEDMMWRLKDKYETITTLFDNDEAGKKALERYKTKYGVDGFTLDLEKDVSDSIAKYGKEHVKDNLIPLLTESIYTCRRCNGTSTLA